MAFYQHFTFKATGTPLASVADFTAAATGTLFEKNSGELYIKLANGNLDRATRALDQLGFKNNTSATIDPVATDDSAAGYSVGSVWVNLTSDTAFTCVDNTNGAAVWSAGGGAGIIKKFTATGDGVKTAYSVADFVEPGFAYTVNSGNLAVHIDGVYQQGAAYVETNSTTITFSSPVPNGSAIEVRTTTSSAVQGDKLTEYVFTGDGTTTAFGAVQIPGFTYIQNNGSIIVVVGGVVQNSNDYTETNTTTVTLGVAPANGVPIAIKVLGEIKIADAIPVSQKGVADGVATLDSTGKVPSAQLSNIDIVSRVKERMGGFNTGILTPLYKFPTTNVWSDPSINAIIDAAKTNQNVTQHVIINPNSGPGTTTDATWLRAIRRLQGAGCYVYGYVPTGYSATAASVVTSTVDTWLSLYSTIDGIYFDEMSNTDTQTDRDLYKSYNDYAHSLGLGLNFGNPGTTVPATYFTQDTMDVIVTAEGSTYPAASTYTGNWADSYMEINKNRRGALVYAQASLDKAAFDQLRKYNGFVYVTSGLFADAGGPWASFPTYFSEMVDLIQHSGSVPSTSKGVANGVATLDANGVIPASQISKARQYFLAQI